LLGPSVICPDGCRVVIVANSRVRHADQRLRNVHGIEVSCSTLWWATHAGVVPARTRPSHGHPPCPLGNAQLAVGAAILC
jgi:hypothetical protein